MLRAIPSLSFPFSTIFFSRHSKAAGTAALSPVSGLLSPRFALLSPRALVSGLLSLVSCLFLSAQLEILNEFPYDPDNLIETVFVGEGISLQGVNYEGDARSAAYFKGGLPYIGIDRGIVMTTGYTIDDANPLESITEPGSSQSGNNANSPLTEDIDIRTLVGNTAIVHDIISYTITFQPISDSVNFRYVFASEEYPEFVCSRFNDVFGFFISGPGINGPYSDNAINIARVPGSDLPVRINSVNPGVPGSSAAGGMCDEPESSLDFSHLFVDNNNSSEPPIFDGFTRVFDASVSLQACETYTIKLVIADVGDSNYDSAVFLEARSFSGEGTNLDIVNLSIDGTLIEGCGGAELHFYTPEPVETDLELETTFFGDATAGLDYTLPPMDLTIPAGDSLLIVPVEALNDAINDSGEEILISLRRSACRTDTFKIRIEENQLESLDLPDNTLVCGGDQVDLSAQVIGPAPTTFSFSNSQDINLTFLGGWQESEIDVSGVIPDILSEETFLSICIDELDHNRPAQIDAFLISPTGVPVELTTDNGGAGNNNATDGYFNTCFRPDAATRIAEPGQQAPAAWVPFTGDWRPEGELSDLWFGDQPANGTWTLRVRDDAAFTNGELRGWSINFQRPYELQYEWSSEVATIDCPECPDTDATAFGEGAIVLRVTDTYGCELVDSFQLDFSDVPSFAPPVCDMVTDSSISIDWGDSPEALFYEVSTDGVNWTPVGTTSSFTLTGLGFEEETQLFVRGQFADCVGPVYPVSCLTLPCVPPTIETLITTTCAGGDAATVELVVSGGRPPYTYLLDGVADADGFFDGLAAGDYTFSVIDDRGCGDSIQVEITDPPAFSGDLAVVETISCGGQENGSLAALPIGGVGPFTYSWNGTPGDSTITQLPAGEYVLEMTDANGCTYTETFELTEPDPLEAMTNSTNQNCDGSVNGTASVFLSGGSPDYDYTWDVPGQGNSQTATGLAAGDYQVTVTDASNCELILDISVGMEPPVDLTAMATDISCFGQNSGSISTMVNIGLAPLEYDWTGPVIPSGPDGTNLPAGTYELVVTDARGCSADTSLTINEPAELFAVAEVENVSCGGEASGAIDLSPSGGTAPYSYAWSNESDQQDPGGLTAGTYDLVLTDANGCSFNQTYVVAEEAPIELSFNVEGTDCPDAATGSLITNLQNGEGPYTFAWSNGAATSDLSGLTAGRYYLEVTDVNGCTALAEVDVPGPDPFVAEVVSEGVRCHGGADGLIEIDLSGGTPGYQFRLDGSSWQRPNSFVGLLPGRYTLEVRDENGCELRLDGLVVDEPDLLSISLGEDQIIDWGDSIWLTPTIDGGTVPVSRYEWTPNDSLLFSCTNCAGTWAYPLVQTSVQLRVFDAAGCIADDLITIFVEKSFPVQVPTGFTPNGDRLNDLLLVHGQPGVEIVRFQIFDRWGETVYQNGGFEVNDESVGWDGNFRGEPMNGGVFLWQLTALLPDGEEAEFRGQTTLIR